MKRTRKLVAAQDVLKAIGPGKALVPKNASQDDIYRSINGQGYYWDSKSGAWKYRAPTDKKPGRGLPANLFRLRVTAHQDVIGQVCETIRQNYSVLEESDLYPNSRDGYPEIVRVYMLLEVKP